MSDLLQLLPIYAFMLIPLWIPLSAMAFGLVSDAIKAPARSVSAHQKAAIARHAAEPARRRVSPVGPRVPAVETAR